MLLLCLPATFSILFGRRSVDFKEQVLNDVDDGVSYPERLPSGRRCVDLEEMLNDVDDGASYPGIPPVGRRSVDPGQSSKNVLRNKIFRS